ncbi:Transposable element [Phytophthora megakarya]|uniref:Transposable element n=1 Tax=Phytophthora megakarya TaxID=4795 RepID=A0A225VMX9_9STRA|nr:Transposable element [Phytophthora megakarya]
MVWAAFIYRRKSPLVYRCIKAHKGNFSEQEFKVLDRPFKSPDLTPIANLWSIMSRRVYQNGKQFDRVLQLNEARFEVWEGIPITILLSLIESMPC